MSMLPSKVTSALESYLEGKRRSDLAERSRSITSTYQKRRNSSHALVTAEDALAYALARMPATYAATVAALGHLLQAAPDFTPASLLDVGCGPGTASFAAHAIFPSLIRLHLIDRNGPFLDLAQSLARDAFPAGFSEIAACDLDQPGPLPRADLVIASYVLAELPPATQRGLISRLWDTSKGALLIVEPGTPDGHARLMEARQALLDAGGHIAAPCTHEAACPMSGDRWCRFFTRVQRSRDHRLLKGGERPFEDEPFAYLAVTRESPMVRKSHRIVNRPTERKFDIALELCGSKGLEHQITPSRDRQIFKQVKRLQWGDAVLIPIQGAQTTDEV